VRNTAPAPPVVRQAGGAARGAARVPGRALTYAERNLQAATGGNTAGVLVIVATLFVGYLYLSRRLPRVVSALTEPPGAFFSPAGLSTAPVGDIVPRQPGPGGGEDNARREPERGQTPRLPPNDPYAGSRVLEIPAPAGSNKPPFRVRVVPGTAQCINVVIIAALYQGYSRQQAAALAESYCAVAA